LHTSEPYNKMQICSYYNLIISKASAC
jgi:hypothetical protein